MSYSDELKERLAAVEMKKECCRAAYSAGLGCTGYEAVCENDAACFLRGLFVAHGSMTDPEKQFYLSFDARSSPAAALALGRCGVTPLWGSHRGKKIVYVRETDSISDFLTAVGASHDALRVLELSVLKSMKREANRASNAEFANMDKTATASAYICEAILLLKKHRDFAKLPEPLKETARLRLEFPELSLDALRAKHSSPISKSGLNHRLQTIADRAEKYRNK